MSEKPVVFIQVDGGVADWEVLRGDVDVVLLDWDSMDSGVLTDFDAKIAEIENLPRHEWRESALLTLRDLRQELVAELAEEARRKADKAYCIHKCPSCGEKVHHG